MFGSQGDSGRERLATSSVEEDQVEENQLSRLLERVDTLCEGCQEDQIQAYNILKAQDHLVGGGLNIYILSCAIVETLLYYSV